MRAWLTNRWYMPVVMIVVVLPLFLLFSQMELFGRIEDQNLVVGRAVTIETPYEIGDVAISDSSICNFIIRENRRELYLNPLKEGTTSMTIWDRGDQKQDAFAIQVVAVSLDMVRRQAQEFADQIPGVRVMVAGDQVILVGEVNSPLYLRQVNEFVRGQKKIINQVALSQRAMEVVADRIEKAIAVPGIKVRTVRDQLIMEGITYSEDQYKKVETIAKLYAPDIVNLVEMRRSDRRPGYDATVKLDVYFMEIKNTAIRQFGVTWMPGATAKNPDGEEGGSSIGIENAIQTLVGYVTHLFPKIDWLHQTGRGRVLEKPSFIVKSGESADFYSGTEVPYETDNEIEFKEVGARISASPIAHQGAIDLKLEVKISSLSAIVDGGIDRNEVTTSVYLESSQSVVLAGLLRNGDVKTYGRKPDDINDATALFPLYFSKDFQTNKSQFYVFITPTILEEPDSAEGRLKRWLEINKEIELTRRAR